MSKKMLIETIAQQKGVTKVEAGRIVDDFIEGVTSVLKNGEEVSIVGFGKFEVKATKARKGRNPSTGKEISIAASKRPVFKAGKALKDAVK
ncbi:MAG: HU family DNA-binding protein [Methyloprofundus sp.]|nr:HU family DNA-binding protein [Methyloprofundus sp.]